MSQRHIDHFAWEPLETVLANAELRKGTANAWKNSGPQMGHTAAMRPE